MVGKTGFEPATPWSQTKCSTKLSHFPINMVRSKGFEPLTFWFVAKHSIQLSYERMPRNFYKWWLQRELNQRHKDFQSSALPTELWSQKKWRSRRESNSRSSAWQADVITATPRDQNGCGRWIWTNDLWVMSPTSYQAALSRDIIYKQVMAEKEGFEPPRRRRPPGFQDRSLQPDLGISPKFVWQKWL